MGLGWEKRLYSTGQCSHPDLGHLPTFIEFNATRNSSKVIGSSRIVLVSVESDGSWESEIYLSMPAWLGRGPGRLYKSEKKSSKLLDIYVGVIAFWLLGPVICGI